MIETLSTARLEAEEDVAYGLEITGIEFDSGDLSKPIYPSLFDYGHAPAGVQFEPGLQIRQGPVGQLRFLYQIDLGAGVIFDLRNVIGDVRVSSVADPSNDQPPGLVSAKLVDGDTRKCEVVWDQDEADKAGFGRLNTLRIHCVFADGRAQTAVERVEGGLYLTLVNREEAPFDTPSQNPKGVAIQATVKMLGFDDEGRPVYDLFNDQSGLSSALVLEPAFRCREGQIVSFDMVLDLPADIDLEFVTKTGTDQVAVAGFLPEGRAFQIDQTTVGYFDGHPNRRSAFKWFQETGRQYCATSNPGEARKCYCTCGQGSTFTLRATEKGVNPLTAGHGRVAELDPTVIQPPSCTSDGICVTP